MASNANVVRRAVFDSPRLALYPNHLPPRINEDIRASAPTDGFRCRSAKLCGSRTTIRNALNRHAIRSVRNKSSVPTDPDGLVTELDIGICAIDLAFRNARQRDVSKGSTGRDI